MIKNNSTDEAISNIIGFILIIGFLTIAWTTVQTVVIPNEDKQVEINHNQEVTNDLIELRSSLINAASSNRVRSVSVNLGTRYPERALFISTPPSNGEIYTKKLGVNGEYSFDSVNLDDTCGIGANSSTIVYTPYYKRTDFPNTSLDNTVLYKESEDGGETVLTKQSLIDGDTIHLYLLKNSISENGVKSVSIDLKPANVTGAREIDSSDVSIGDQLTIPTKLSPDKWSDLLSDENNVTSVTDGGNNKVNIGINASVDYTLKCSVIGTRNIPTIDPDSTLEEIRDDGSDEVNEIGDISLIGVEYNKDGKIHNVTMRFENLADEKRNFTRARLAFHSDPEVTDGDLKLGGNDIRAPLTVLGDFENINPKIIFPSGATNAEIYMRFEPNQGNLNLQGDFFVLVVEYETGVTVTYFVGIPA